MASIKDIDKAGIPTLAQIRSAQSANAYCGSTLASIGSPNTRFNIDNDGVLVRESPLDGALRRVVCTSLCSCPLHIWYYSVLAGHPGIRRMYDSMSTDLYWSSMVNDVYTTVRDCRFCA